MSKYQGTEKERQQARDRMQRMRERRAVTGVTGVKSMGVTSPEDKLEVLYLIEGYAPAIVCAVNGFYIRNHVYIDFTEGGNTTRSTAAAPTARPILLTLASSTWTMMSMRLRKSLCSCTSCTNATR